MILNHLRSIFRWRKSIWKHVWLELLVYIGAYLLIGVIYRFALPEQYQPIATQLILYFNGHHNEVPLTFILSLYVGLVMTRWWDQYNAMPWPDELALQICGAIHAHKEKGRLVRRTMMRYCLLSYVLALRTWSSRLRVMFPKVSDIVETGLLREDEVDRLREEDEHKMYQSRWWVPISWSMQVLSKAQRDGLAVNAPVYASLVSQIRVFKEGLQTAKNYDHLRVPLVYSQVISLAVHVYFWIHLIGDQYVIGQPINLVFPFLLTFKFLFFLGLLSVVETRGNPWGINDEDFHVNQLLERHLIAAMAIVDESEEPPEMKKEAVWDNKNIKMPNRFYKDTDDIKCFDVEKGLRGRTSTHNLIFK